MISKGRLNQLKRTADTMAPGGPIERYELKELIATYERVRTLDPIPKDIKYAKEVVIINNVEDS